MKKFIRGNVIAFLIAAILSVFVPALAFDSQAAVSYGDYLQVQIGETKKGMRLYEDGMYETTIKVPAGVDNYQIIANDEVIKDESLDNEDNKSVVLIRYYSKDS